MYVRLLEVCRSRNRETCRIRHGFERAHQDRDMYEVRDPREDIDLPLPPRGVESWSPRLTAVTLSATTHLPVKLAAECEAAHVGPSRRPFLLVAECEAAYLGSSRKPFFFYSIETLAQSCRLSNNEEVTRWRLLQVNTCQNWIKTFYSPMFALRDAAR